MAVNLVAVGQRITAAAYNALARDVNRQGLTGIVPTSATGTGVVAAAGGKVTFTNATFVSLGGVFTGGYENYRITWSSSTRSAAASTQFRLRQAGTDITTATYDYVKSVVAGTATTVTSSAAATGIPLDAGVAAGMRSAGVFDLFGPALPSPCLGTCQSTVLAGSAATGIATFLQSEVTTGSDGFSIYPLSGTWSGVLRVYGYNNLA